MMNSTTQSIQTSISTTTATAWTPPDYGSAESAVDAYLKVREANDAGLKDPNHPPTSEIEKYSQGQGRLVMEDSIADEVKHGTAWRGMPWARRVVVINTKPKVNEVILSDCPQPNSSWEQYDVKTGKAIPQQVRTPPPPYLATVTMFKVQGTWVMVSLRLDGAKTCTR
jgi:hypothetical protein